MNKQSEMTDETLSANYDEVARLLNYKGEEGGEVMEALDNVAEEADENGLTAPEKFREMVRSLYETQGANRSLALRAAAILELGYDVDGGR